MPAFSKRLIDWQRRHGRHDLPWQGTIDPYRVWLSEIMLQQTQVATVIPYYPRFLQHFPTLAELAAAPLDDVLAQWSGLGYYARARNLHRCAQVVMRENGGCFPETPETLAALPGIGRSTANAIAAFCFGARAPILDGNVKRLLCRHRGIEGFPGDTAVENQLWQDAAALLPKRATSTYIQAQMDIGATICTRSRPHCERCPVSADCIALATGRVADLPAPRPRRALPLRNVTLLLLRDGDRVLLEQRPPSGIWGGLWSLPELPPLADAANYCAEQLGNPVGAVSPAPTFTHTFTHFRLRITPLFCAVDQPSAPLDKSRRWRDGADLAQTGLPTPIRRLLDQVFNARP